jgi:hypothetical protein
VSDWIVPVVYSNGIDFVIQRLSASLEQREQDEKIFVSNQLRGNYINVMIGRDFDCLRSEQVISQRGVAILNGRAGIGKTFLLEQISDWWNITRYYDHFLLLSSAKGTFSKLVETIYSAIKDTGCSCLGRQDGATDSLADLSTGEKAQDPLMKLLRDHSMILLLDNVQNAFSHLPEGLVVGRLPQVDRQNVISFREYSF